MLSQSEILSSEGGPSLRNPADSGALPGARWVPGDLLIDKSEPRFKNYLPGVDAAILCGEHHGLSTQTAPGL